MAGFILALIGHILALLVSLIILLKVHNILMLIVFIVLIPSIFYLVKLIKGNVTKYILNPFSAITKGINTLKTLPRFGSNWLTYSFFIITGYGVLLGTFASFLLDQINEHVILIYEIDPGIAIKIGSLIPYFSLSILIYYVFLTQVYEIEL